MNSEFGNRRLVGQKNAREQIMRSLESGRSSHAYLFSGPSGVGKTAFALAFAEALNGISNLTDLGSDTHSVKSSWRSHPDIHMFIPLPKNVAESRQLRSTEMRSRLGLLHKDPYDIVDFKLRPVLDDESSSKNRQAFYPINYFREEIRPVCRLKPNEGRYTVVVITDIESMRIETANAFLKLLEEPPENVIFLLTTSGTEKLLPTIISRCRLIRMHPLSEEEIAGALTLYDSLGEEDAAYLARISGGNYSITRFYDLALLQETRREVAEFLRMTYVQDAGALLQRIQDWQSRFNTENQIALCNTVEMILRDLMVFRETGDKNLITNIDQLEMIRKFCESLQEARIPEMIGQLQNLKGLLYQNVQFKLVFTSLAFRFGSLMRGQDPVIPADSEWKHLPALNL